MTLDEALGNIAALFKTTPGYPDAGPPSPADDAVAAGLRDSVVWFARLTPGTRDRRIIRECLPITSEELNVLARASRAADERDPIHLPLAGLIKYIDIYDGENV